MSRLAVVLGLTLAACATVAPAPRTEPREPAPPVDRDGDGIVDATDACPCSAEDADGFDDGDGCPDQDDDGDRLPDACDACPRVAETYNGVCDEDGCPDHGYATETDEVVIVEVVRFARASATLDGSSEPLIDALARTIAAHPELGPVTVVGGAARGERGGDALAHARAQAVVEALVAHGIARERLVIDGGGSAREVRFELRDAPAPAPRPVLGPCQPTRACPASEAVAC